jgi:hypothetical protein
MRGFGASAEVPSQATPDSSGSNRRRLAVTDVEGEAHLDLSVRPGWVVLASGADRLDWTLGIAVDGAVTSGKPALVKSSD